MKYFLNQGVDISHYNLTVTPFDSYRDALEAYDKALKDKSLPLVTLTKAIYEGKKGFKYLKKQEVKKTSFVRVYGYNPLDFIELIEKEI